jgi:hypothetical protein
MSTDDSQPKRKQRTRQAGSASRRKRDTGNSASQAPTIPMTIRPRREVKAMAEAVARQLDERRSKLDSEIYALGALVLGIKELGQKPQIGTLSRKEAASRARPLLQPIFELLHEQAEMPYLFRLVLGTASARSAGSQTGGGTEDTGLLPTDATALQTYQAFSSQATEEALTGFPEEL